MAADPVTLDFSKAQPIQQAGPAQGSQGVTLDFSKAQPLPGQGLSDYWGTDPQELSDFMKNNPGYEYLPADPAFPARRPGVYPGGQGSEWRKNPHNGGIDQFPIDLHGGKHTYEGIKLGAMAATAPLAMPFASEVTLPQFVGALAGGTVGEVAGSKLAEKAGAGETSQEVAGDVGGLVGGGLGAKAADWATVQAMAAFKSLHPEVQKALIGMISPRAREAIRFADALNTTALKKSGTAAASKATGAPANTSGAPETGEGEISLARQFAAKVYGHLRELLGTDKAPGTAATAKETPEDFVERQTAGRAQVKPNAEGKTVDAATGEPVEQAPREDEDTRTAAEKQASLDKYYKAHPDKRPQQKIVQRGPKKGQVKTVRVFDQGEWHEVPVYK